MSHLTKYWESNHPDILPENKEKLNEYLLSLKLANKAVSTVSKYRKILEAFLLETPILVEKLTSDDIRKWLNDFSLGKSEGTIIFYLSVITQFFNFCLDEDYMDQTIVKKRWRPKLPHSLPKYLDEHEYARVLLNLEQLSERDRAIVLFLFTTGCRVSEVSNLNIEDVNFEKRTVEVVGKGNKLRQSYFSDECGIVLSAYLQTRTSLPSDPVFISKFGKRLQPNGIRKVLQKAGKGANLKQSLHPHCCRHTFATNMLARGADLQFIADVLGHSNLNTTRIYAQIPTEELMVKYQNIMG
ncbi:tyrosine-type recombinase/integrase [Sporosarcina newyorkensis]|uniref:tyrosine-type recombinase/integrase n=1 Tax=Sporosarcina newyorkensis TaxID=759851 RepID=UPI003D0516EE